MTSTKSCYTYGSRKAVLLGFYHFNHNAVYKRDTHADTKTQEGFIGNIVGYRARLSSCDKIITQNVAPYPRQMTEALVNAFKNTKRKDGRVLDRFNIGLPNFLSQDQMEEVTRKTLFRYTQGRTVAMGFLHDLDSHNPHLHVILVDQDIDTGKRVYGVTKLNSIKRMRIDWEDVCNNHLAHCGYDVTIDHRSKKDMEQDVANDNIDVFGDEVDDLTAPESKDEVAKVQPSETPPKSIEARIKDASTAIKDFQYIRDCIETLGSLKDRKSQTAKELMGAKEQLANHHSSVATSKEKQAFAMANLETHQTKDGVLRGWETPDFLQKMTGIKYQSRSRRVARAVEGVAVERSLEVKQREGVRNLSQEGHDDTEKAHNTIVDSVHQYEDALQVYGTEEEAELAMEYQYEGARVLTKDIALEELHAIEPSEELTPDEIETVSEHKKDLDLADTGQSY